MIIKNNPPSMQGLKRKRRCEDECKDHLFSLTCLKANSAKYDIKLLFCPKYQRDPIPPQFIHPQFNDDRKYYTSTFILGVDRRVLVKNEQQEIMDHQKQVRDSLEKHNQLVFPRPNSKHSHCSVCKDHYRNYYLHIATEEHRLRIALSPYNAHIKGLCSMYEYLWEGAEERADIEGERRAVEEEERRQRMSELTVREEVEEEESLLDVQRGDPQEGDEQVDQEEPEQYRAKQSKKRHNYYENNDDTVPLARSCKRAGPATGRIYQSEYLRKKQLMNSLMTAQRLHKQREERRYQRQRDRCKIERDFGGTRQFFKVLERQGDVFVVMKAHYTFTANSTNNNATNAAKTNAGTSHNHPPNVNIHAISNNHISTATTVKNTQNILPQQRQPPPQVQSQGQSQTQFVWKRAERFPRREQRQKQKEKEAVQPQINFWRRDRLEKDIMTHPNHPPSITRPISSSFHFDLPINLPLRPPLQLPDRIQKENRKYEIHYEAADINKDVLAEDNYDLRFQYYPYPPPPTHYLPPPPVPQSSNSKETFGKGDKHDPFKQEPVHSFKHEQRGGFQVRNEGKPYENYKNTAPPYYPPPYPYPIYQHYPREENYYPKQKQGQKVSKLSQKPFDYPEVPNNWPYPPPSPYYMPPYDPHPVKTQTVPPSTTYPGNTNISINFPMYMCPPPPPPSYPVSSGRYSSPPYMGYNYPPSRESPGFGQHYHSGSHQYDLQSPPQGGHQYKSNYQQYSNMHHYHSPSGGHFQYPPHYPPSSQQMQQKKTSKF